MRKYFFIILCILLISVVLYYFFYKKDPIERYYDYLISVLDQKNIIYSGIDLSDTTYTVTTPGIRKKTLDEICFTLYPSVNRFYISSTDPNFMAYSELIEQGVVSGLVLGFYYKGIKEIGDKEVVEIVLPTLEEIRQYFKNVRIENPLDYL